MRVIQLLNVCVSSILVLFLFIHPALYANCNDLLKNTANRERRQGGFSIETALEKLRTDQLNILNSIKNIQNTLLTEEPIPVSQPRVLSSEENKNKTKNTETAKLVSAEERMKIFFRLDAKDFEWYAPIDFTKKLIGDDLATHYFWKESQVQIPALKNAMRSVVKIGDFGTGFLVSDKGHVLTNAHVAKEINFTESLTLNNTQYSLHDAKIMAYPSNYADLALLHLPSLKGIGSPLKFASEEPVSNTDVFSVGFPGELNTPIPLLSYGSLTNYQDWYFMSNVEIRNGSSGSPVLNLDGKVIGVAFRGRSSIYTMESFMVRLNEIRSFLSKHLPL